MRLQKFLAEAGLGSRRGCEDLIRAGRVTIDGETATLGVSVDPQRQSVAVDGELVSSQETEYWLLNKPPDVLSTVFDPQGRPTVLGCVPARSRVFPVGRLDLNSTGLLLLTNDGDLAARLLHPRYHVDKEYLVTARGVIDETAIHRLREGVVLEEGLTAPAEVVLVGIGESGDRSPTTTLRITLHEGRKRQIRRMLEKTGYRVLTLHRCRFDGLTDSGLGLGQARRLSDEEVRSLRRAAGLS